MPWNYNRLDDGTILATAKYAGLFAAACTLAAIAGYLAITKLLLPWLGRLISYDSATHMLSINI